MSSLPPEPQPPLGLVAQQYNFARQFVRLVGPYWNSEQKWKVRGFTLVLVALTFAQVALAVWTNYWNRALFDTLENRSLPSFLMQIGTFVIIFILTMSVTAVHLRVKRWLQLGWRKWLTEHLLDHWMSRGHHYQLIFTPGEHDNPDGRIAEDIHIVTETAIALAHTFVYSILILWSFIDILMSVTGSANVPGTAVNVPGYMVVLAFVYAGVGAGLGLLLGRPLIKSTNRLQTAEASFRFGLGRLRGNSESIALMRGEPVERQRSARLFRDIEWHWERQTFAYTWILFFTSGYGALLPVFPILVAAPQYIAGTMTLGVLMQAAQAFQKLTSALSWPVDNLADMAKCRASADRVLSIYDDLLALEEKATRPEQYRIDVQHARSPDYLEIRNLCIASSDGQILLEHFNLSIRRGEHLLIAGDPAIAISLFKVLARLWPWGQGEVLLPQNHDMFFMPQRPFLPYGTLQSVLTYPLPPETFDARTLHHALECAGLAWLSSRLQESDSWDRVLPLRAQQRLGFARLFLHRPSWIFIEEATDAFDPKGEDCMMEMLRRELPNATLLTIGFHPGLERFHSRKIVLNRVRKEKYLFQDAPACLLSDRPDGFVEPG
ncbi:MAG TPA: ABC transporter ATP-binding protein/permease [Pseudomonadales bacterium]|nr:ABC transporter ATP-binding protein/permease [Pseudomonadales bacterium]